MEKLLPQAETLEDLHAKLVCASYVWVDLRNRSTRCGDRDSQLLAKRDRAMNGIDILLDRYVVLNALENGEVEDKDALLT